MWFCPTLHSGSIKAGSGFLQVKWPHRCQNVSINVHVSSIFSEFALSDIQKLKFRQKILSCRVLHTCLVDVVMVTHSKAEQTNDGIWTDINTVDSISTGSFDMFSYTYFDQRVTFLHSDKFHSKMSKISLK